MPTFIMAGPLQATGFVVLFALLGLFLPFIGIFISVLSNAAIALVTLRQGWQSGLRVICFASLIIAGLGLILFNQPTWALISTLIQWLPVFMMANLLKRTMSWNKMLVANLGLVIAGLMLFHAAVNTESYWKGQFELIAKMPMLEQAFAKPEVVKAFEAIATFATGFASALLCLLTTASLMLGRYWQAKLYNPGGFGDELRSICLPALTGLAIGAMLTLILFSRIPLVTDIVFAGMAIFLFQGISLVHSFHAMLNLQVGWLVGFYLALLLVPVQLGILLSTFGIIDSIADFRKVRHR